MNDKALNALIRSTLLTQMATALPGVDAVRNFQQRQQGANSGPCVHFVKIGDHRFGHPFRGDVLNEAGQVFSHTELQKCETTYQLSALVPQDPADTSELTESDVLNIVSGIIQSDRAIATFRAAGVGIQRVTDVRNPYVVDEHDQFEANPSFDIVFTHDRVNVTTIPAVTTYGANIRRV